VSTRLIMDGDDLIEHRSEDVEANLEFAKSLHNSG
jgi:hypothetical protein